MKAQRIKPASLSKPVLRPPPANAKESLRSRVLIFMVITLLSPVLLAFKIGMKVRGLYGLSR